MLSSTQTMENTTFDSTPSLKNPDDMPEYVSIYDKPKRGIGRPRGSKYTDEEKRQRKIKIAQQYYQNNFDYVRLQKRIWLDKNMNNEQKISNQKKKEFQKTNYFLAFR